MIYLEKFLAWDEQVSRKLRVAEKNGWLRRIAALFAHSGDSWFWFVGLGIVWLKGEMEWRQRASIYLVAIVVLAVLVMLLKFSIRRKRPEGDWGAIYRQTDPHSFPSGHAARAFLLAMLGLGLGPLWWGILLAVWAPLVSLARVAMGVHYPSDVLAGMLIGLMAGGATLILLG